MRLTQSPIVTVVAAAGLVLLAARNLQAQEFKIDVQSLKWGLRMVTDTPGGMVGLFGPIGDFVIDAPSVPGGRLTIKENGNVGIGTASPAARLHIANASSSGAGLFIEASEGDRAAMYYSPNTGVVFDSFRPGDARRLPVLLQPNGGNVGIGTAGPGKALHISTSTNSGHLAIGGANQNAMMFVNAANSTTHGFLVGRSYSSDDANTFFIYDLTANANRLLIDDVGRVSIGTTDRYATLHVVDTFYGEGAIYAESNSVDGVAVTGVSTGTGVGVRAMSFTGNLMEGDSNASGSYFRRFHITNQGTYVAGGDFAEALPARGDRSVYERGDLLVVSTDAPGHVEKASHPYDPRVVGIYSTRPGMLGADKDGTSRVDADELPVAIVGIVPAKVSAENGPVGVGDLLTTSGTEGYAMRCDNPLKCMGAIVGKALEPLAKGEGVIRVLVMLR